MTSKHKLKEISPAMLGALEDASSCIYLSHTHLRFSE